MFVCDDGERLKGGGGEARVLVTLAQAAKPGVVLRQREHLIAAGDLFDAESGALARVALVQRIDVSLDVAGRADAEK